MIENVIRERLSYDPETGIIIWIKKGSGSGRFSEPGTIAGTLDNRGYVQIYLKRKIYYAHRIAWLLVHGHWPSKHIDHINGDKADNRLSNLREATVRQNGSNKTGWKPRAPQNAHLPTGVRIQDGKYAARIRIDGREVHLGRFATVEEARDAYISAAVRTRGEFTPHAQPASACSRDDFSSHPPTATPLV